MIRNNTMSSVKIVVVCDKCDDGTVEFIESENGKDDFIGIVNDKKLGSVASIKIGLYAALGDYVAIINDDVEVMPGWDLQIVATIDADERAGCAVPLVVNSDGTAQSVGQHNPYRSNRYKWIGQVPAVDHQAAVGKYLFNFKHFHSARECDYGYFPVLKRKCLERIGFVDDSYQHYYVDPDIGYLVQSCGLKNIYCPTSVFVHHHKSIAEIGHDGVQLKAMSDLIHFSRKWELSLID
jgi:GT2 family glycosyltransferase